MSRRTSTISAILGLVAALSLALPVLAKEGAEAKLDTALPRDAEPGSTIDVGWSVFMIEGDETHPLYGSPIYLRLVGPDGTSTTEVMGTESPAGSGHYTASIEVPSGGIAEVIVGMVGEACVPGAGCKRSDLIFLLTDDPLVTGAAPAVAPPTRSTPIGTELLPIIALGVVFAVAGALAALVAGRRRVIEAPAGR